jgi:hypothetical protein
MVGQGDVPIEQTNEEIAQAAEVEITREERLAWNVDTVDER